MNWTERRERFRAILAGNQCVHPASVFDPISARIAEDLEFEVGMYAGSVASMAVLGAPDIVLLTLTEFADQAYRICRAGNLALLVDAASRPKQHRIAPDKLQSRREPHSPSMDGALCKPWSPIRSGGFRIPNTIFGQVRVEEWN